MLALIPRYPRKIDPATLRRRLSDAGFDVTIRTVQRDLITLESQYPLQCDDASKPHGWSWEKTAALVEFPAMDPQTALTLTLVGDYLEPMLPRTTLTFLEPHMKSAAKVLDAVDRNSLSDWPQRVRVIPSGQALKPPVLDKEVLDVVYGATLSGHRLDIRYRKAGATDIDTYEVNPLGVVVRDGAVFLVCTMWEYDDVRLLATHRMVSAEGLGKLRRIPDHFDLDDYIAAGAFGFRLGNGAVTFKANVRPELAAILEETPLSSTQTIDGDGAWRTLRATLPMTKHLRGWVLRYGAMIEVLEPSTLREDVAAEAFALAELYGG